MRFLIIVALGAIACTLLVAFWLFAIALPRDDKMAGAQPQPVASRQDKFARSDVARLQETEREGSIDTAIGLETAIVLGSAIAFYVPFAKRQLLSER